MEGDRLADGDGGQVHPVGDVADGPDVLGRGLGIGIDLDRALIVQLDPGGLEPQILDVGDAAGGEHDHVGFQLHAVFQVVHQSRLGLFDGLVLATQDDLDAALSRSRRPDGRARRRRSRAGYWGRDRSG